MMNWQTISDNNIAPSAAPLLLLHNNQPGSLPIAPAIGARTTNPERRLFAGLVGMAEQARKQIEAGTFAGQPSMLDALERLARRGEK